MKEVTGLGMLVFRISYFCYPDSVYGKNEVSFFLKVCPANIYGVVLVLIYYLIIASFNAFYFLLFSENLRLERMR